MTLLPTPQPTLSSVLKLSTSVWSFSGVRASRQGPSLHSSKAAAAPWQESPPLRASLETFRWRSLIPSPQDLEQGLHPSHSVHSQSTISKNVTHDLILSLQTECIPYQRGIQSFHKPVTLRAILDTPLRRSELPGPLSSSGGACHHHM